MNRAIGLALLIGGIVLLILGLQASHSLSSDVSRAINGTPNNNAMWLMAAGIVMAIVGLFLSFRSGTGTRM